MPAVARSTYNYGSTVRAPRPRTTRPQVRVTPGSRKTYYSATQSASRGIVYAAVAVAVILIVAATLCIARIALTNAAVTTSMQSKELNTQIAQARSEGGVLEVQQATLSNPARIKAEAEKLKMAAPTFVDSIALGEDVVQLNESGDLSFAESIRVASNISAKG